jgi:peptide deformylase
MKKIELKIHTWPEKILRTKCRKVEVVDENIREILDEMCFLMRSHKGVGLAANQAGVGLCLAVIEAQDRIFKLVNPCIIKKNGKVSISEGCLSFPGLELEIKRANKIWVRSLNEKGEPMDLEVEGVLAIIFQHEIDHLDGICFINRIPFWRRLRIFKKLREIKKETKNGLRK